jgi:hypothetical protein
VRKSTCVKKSSTARSDATRSNNVSVPGAEYRNGVHHRVPTTVGNDFNVVAKHSGHSSGHLLGWVEKIDETFRVGAAELHKGDSEPNAAERHANRLGGDASKRCADGIR